LSERKIQLQLRVNLPLSRSSSSTAPTAAGCNRLLDSARHRACEPFPPIASMKLERCGIVIQPRQQVAISVCGPSISLAQKKV
jgi:hypothetical protein